MPAGPDSGRFDANQDGQLDQGERQSARQARRERTGQQNGDTHQRSTNCDCDGNRPGPRGGQGNNWENPPGQVGGPGMSPDRPGRCGNEGNQGRPRFDRGGGSGPRVGQGNPGNRSGQGAMGGNRRMSRR